VTIGQQRVKGALASAPRLVYATLQPTVKSVTSSHSLLTAPAEAEVL
jgi:hypothetical protein